jgi:GNAT superfamily N-acetyltransferase
VILISDANSYHRYATSIEEFLPIYEEAFPDVNEREDWTAIADRCTNESAFPQTFMVFSEEDQELNGGIISDYYPSSGVIHLIYIAIQENKRGTGIARKLILDLLPKAIEQLEKEKGFSAKVIIFESNIPWKTEVDSIDPTLRLKIFGKLGAKFIPIDYVQPALSESRTKVENLFLLSFPLDRKPFHHTLNTNVLKHFLHEFYIGLGIEQPEKNEDFLHMCSKINSLTFNKDQMNLEAIPVLESNHLTIRKASICVQFSTESDINSEENRDKCPFFYSYETDLLSSHFQNRRPFSTYFNQDKGIIPITIHFPSYYHYLSEGTRFSKASVRTDVQANLHINQSISTSGDTNTWSIVISTGTGDYFNENEVIKLLNFFGSKQEDVRMLEEIEFSTEGIQQSSFQAFIGAILHWSDPSLISIHTGVLQLDTEHISFNNEHIQFTWSDFYLRLKNFHEGHENAAQDYERNYYDNEDFKLMNNVFCGFALGIFDFERMDFDEVTDTLIPRKANENYLLLMNRGILICACHDDEMYESTLHSIGISPYLLIPNMILANNVHQLDKIDVAVNDLLSKVDNKEKVSLNQLRATRGKIDNWLNNGYFPSIFQYPSEKDLYAFGTNHRGLQEYRNNLEQSIKTIDDLKDELISNRQENSDLMMTILLTLLSGVQFQGIFESFTNGDVFKSWMYTVLFSFCLTGAIYYFTKMKMKK